jgi:methyl-accepting chemotaxis protein
MVRNAGGGSQRIVQDFGSALDATIQKLSSTLSQTVSDLARMSTEAADAMSKASDSIENTSDVLKSTMSSVELGVQRMNRDLDKIHQIHEKIK